MQHPGSLAVPVSGQQGGQLSTKSLAENKMWSGFQTSRVGGGFVCHDDIGELHVTRGG